jgi:hypothetical protein
MLKDKFSVFATMLGAGFRGEKIPDQTFPPRGRRLPVCFPLQEKFSEWSLCSPAQVGFHPAEIAWRHRESSILRCIASRALRIEDMRDIDGRS